MEITLIEVATRTKGTISEVRLIWADGSSEDITLDSLAGPNSMGSGATSMSKIPTKSLRMEILSGTPGDGGVYDALFAPIAGLCLVKNT